MTYGNFDENRGITINDDEQGFAHPCIVAHRTPSSCWWAQYWAQSDGVNPSVETVWNWHTCGSMVFPSHSSSSLSGWPSAGEAEASSAGEQLAEE